jgi:EpsI family protein
MKSPRFWVVFLLLLAALTTLHLRGSVDRVPPSEALSLLPQTIGTWSSEDVPIEEETLQVLGDGDFLNRIYTAAPASDSLVHAPVSLFIGYFPTQRTGQSIHSPQNCLPGAGWTFAASQTIYLGQPERKNYAVGEYLITNGSNKQVVLYWYLAHGRSVANDYLAKAYMMADAIRSNRTDGSLVRLVTPLQPGESLASAQARVITFADNLVPMLPRFIPN